MESRLPIKMELVSFSSRCHAAPQRPLQRSYSAPWRPWGSTLLYSAPTAPPVGPEAQHPTTALLQRPLAAVRLNPPLQRFYSAPWRPRGSTLLCIAPGGKSTAKSYSSKSTVTSLKFYSIPSPSIVVKSYSSTSFLLVIFDASPIIRFQMQGGSNISNQG